MSEELKPCPFCGGAACRYTDYAACQSRDCAGSDFLADIEKWNTRAQPTECEPKPIDGAVILQWSEDGETWDDGSEEEMVSGRAYGWKTRELFTRPAPAEVSQLQDRIQQLELGLGLMRCNYDDGVGCEWEQPVLDFVRTLCPTVDSRKWAKLNGPKQPC